MSAPLDLSVVVPLYNEEESLPHLVEQLLTALRPAGERFELVLVDDGSSDRTADVLARVSAEVPEVVAVLAGPLAEALAVLGFGEFGAPVPEGAGEIDRTRDSQGGGPRSGGALDRLRTVVAGELRSS